MLGEPAFHVSLNASEDESVSSPLPDAMLPATSGNPHCCHDMDHGADMSHVHWL